MTTALDICTQALKAVGVLGVGQTPLAEDTNDTFKLLQQMLAQWQRRRWLVPNLVDVYNRGNGNVSNPIGANQFYNIARPDKIQAAYVRLGSTATGGGTVNATLGDFNADYNNDYNVANVATNTAANTGDFNADFNSDFNIGDGVSPTANLSIPVDYPLRQIFSYEDYSTTVLKTLQSFPYAFFYDAAYPVGNVFVWPVPTSVYEIHLIVKSTLAVPATLATLLVLPPEYEEAIWTNLAIRLCPTYQLSASRELVALAKSALETIKIANAQIASLQMPVALRRGGFYNPYSDTN